MSYYTLTWVKGLQKYQRSKLVFKKNSRSFGFEATFFANLYNELLLFEHPGFDSRCQTLGLAVLHLIKNIYAIYV